MQTEKKISGLTGKKGGESRVWRGGKSKKMAILQSMVIVTKSIITNCKIKTKIK